MYKRFLNDNDYLGVITPEGLAQITRGNAERFLQAEESAEMSIVEYLSENYEVEKELDKGRYIAEYDRQITFPVGVHIYFEGKMYEVIRSMSGYKAPTDVVYWEEYQDEIIKPEKFFRYSQFGTYYVGDIVSYNGHNYLCLAENGYKFGDVRIPLVIGWLPVDVVEWQPVKYKLWKVVKFEGHFYTLVSLEGFDNNKDPMESDCWGAIADYDPEYNEYELSGHEYVVYNDGVYCPEMEVNADIPVVGKNITLHDPRNFNLKKHMVRIAMYELTKLIALNNVSAVRIKDYEESMKWLADAAKLRINPQIPRKLGEDKKEILDWQLATFQTDYDVNKNPWLT